jgi:hypothetical protein
MGSARFDAIIRKLFARRPVSRRSLTALAAAVLVPPVSALVASAGKKNKKKKK